MYAKLLEETLHRCKIAGIDPIAILTDHLEHQKLSTTRFSQLKTKLNSLSLDDFMTSIDPDTPLSYSDLIKIIRFGVKGLFKQMINDFILKSGVDKIFSMDEGFEILEQGYFE